MHLVSVMLCSVFCILTISGEIIKGVSANKNLEVTDQCLFLFGNGDGGGGPTPLMMEKELTK